MISIYCLKGPTFGFDHPTKLRPLLFFLLKMQQTDYNDWENNIFIAFHYLMLANFRIMILSYRMHVKYFNCVILLCKNMYNFGVKD